MQMHRILALTAAILGAAAALVSLRPSAADPTKLAHEIDSEADHISAPELADRIMHRDPSLRVFDLRTPAEFAALHIPTASQISIESLMKVSLPLDADVVLYSEGGTHAAQAWVLLRVRGFKHVHVLREGMYEWISRVYEPKLAMDATPSERAEFDRAAVFSRYFGGGPTAGVPRSEVPTGYWTNEPTPQNKPAPRLPVRRRGC